MTDSPAVHRLRFYGAGRDLFAIQVRTLLLGILTLGIYTFWGRTRTRQYLYAHTTFADAPFEYHGTGRELFIGFLKATAILWVVYIVAALTVPRLVVVVPLLLILIATNSARRWRFSRSSWAGVRFAYDGRLGEFLTVTVPGLLLMVLTLTAYRPFFAANSRRFLLSHLRIGALSFAFDGDGRDLFWPRLRALLLAIPTLGLSLVWYRAMESRYLWEHTTLGPARFRSTVTGGDLLRLEGLNLLILVGTLGLGMPWILARTHAFHCERIGARGDVPWADAVQGDAPASAVGEGLAGAINLDVDMGLAM